MKIGLFYSHECQCSRLGNIQLTNANILIDNQVLLYEDVLGIGSDKESVILSLKASDQ